MASGRYSHAAGSSTIAQNWYQTVIGKHNVPTSATLNLAQNDDGFIIGNGSDGARSNAFRVQYTGNVYNATGLYTGGADYAEMFEWLDGNPQNEDRRGYFVTLQDQYIRTATAADGYILGIVSSTPSVVGDSQGVGWHGMYLRDRFGKIMYEELNPAYDPEKTYVPRNERKEWAAIGMMGKLIVRDDGSCQPNGYCQPNAQGMATASERGYRVLQKMDGNVALIVFR
ncbi:MAG: hypothetical protein FWD25_03590 [Clostridia bacterium]|nr:hypothetical protein [Clostridia bacterium]